MKVTIMQVNIVWENKHKNLNRFSECLELIEGETDIIIFPEMFTTGFTMNSAKFADKPESDTLRWLADNAYKYKCNIIGGIIAQEQDKIYNRQIFMKPDGKYEYYDKRHLFRMANEQKFYSAGSRKVITELYGWRIMLTTCYDLRFPVWTRACNDYDVLVVIANWPEKRRDAWNTLLVARAMENQVYVIGVNRVGKDGNQHLHSGDSAVVHPAGYIMSKTPPYKESVETIELSYKELVDFRKSFPAHLDADKFELFL
ncbi:MAG: amidohydrolase [Bacteroidia bacterium]|nr:amidohydrolase [Bacteroidia bacterium]